MVSEMSPMPEGNADDFTARALYRGDPLSEQRIEAGEKFWSLKEATTGREAMSG
jgi:hypothetical protein